MSTPSGYCDGALEIDYLGCVVKVRGQEVHLTPVQWRVLVELVHHPNIVLSVDQLYRFIWPNENGQRHTAVIKWHISQLRRITGLKEIKTVRGFGYKYIPPPGDGH
jgi:DNA-binding response OmpR family regulator